MKKTIIALGIAIVSSAHAQGVTAMEFTIGATMLAPKGVVASCGLEFNGAAIRPGVEVEADQVAGSVAVHVGMTSLVKAGHQIAYRKQDGIAVRPVNDKVAWIRIEGGIPLTPADDLLIPGEKKPFHLFGISAESAIRAMEAMIQGKTIWVGFSQNGVVTTIFSGRVKQDSRTTQQLDACLGELVASNTPLQKPNGKK